MTAGLEALHEAAHALVAHLVGARVVWVTLESDREGHEGHVEVDWACVSAGPRELARLSAMVALAGPVAELHGRGAELLEDPSVLSSWRGDWQEARASLSRIEGVERVESELEQRLLELVGELHALFADPRTDERLARVADALEAHGALDENLLADVLG